MEKFFSVAAEVKDGTLKVIPARSATAGGAFRHVKELPGVSRVGRITEDSEDEYEALVQGRPVRKAVHAPPPPRPAPGAAQEAGKSSLLERPLAGPRVVSHARQSGGEQPFRHLKAPPERPKPVHVPAPAAGPRQPVVKAKRVAPKARKAPQSVVSSSSADAPTRDYRIVRSRRQGGSPYNLQRGRWLEQNGKRAFEVEWEKGFADRAEAERHQDWVKSHAKDLAEAHAQG